MLLWYVWFYQQSGSMMYMCTPQVFFSSLALTWCHSKCKGWLCGGFQPGPSFAYHFGSERLMRTTIFGIGLVLSENAEAVICETGCNLNLWGNSARQCRSSQSACCCHWQARTVIIRVWQLYGKDPEREIQLWTPCFTKAGLKRSGVAGGERWKRDRVLEREEGLLCWTTERVA